MIIIEKLHVLSLVLYHISYAVFLSPAENRVVFLRDCVVSNRNQFTDLYLQRQQNISLHTSIGELYVDVDMCLVCT